MNKRACLVLADGHIFEGTGIGASGAVIGETVFTTGMTGYLETLTDPSYFGQIVTQTFPLIGNYGVIHPDFESEKSHVRGYVVRDLCDEPSNFRAEEKLETFLIENQIIGICGIDTRKLTKILRESGVMNGMIIFGETEGAKKAFSALKDEKEFQNLLEKIKEYKIVDAVKTVSGNAMKIEKSAQEVFAESEKYRAVPVTKDGLKINDSEMAMKNGRGKKVVLWDFGAKANIRRELLKRGVEVVTVKSDTTAKEILDLNPDGIMLSNGPGDPADNTQIIEEIKKVAANKTPIFGICLGHQMLALSQGAKTSKLKYGHRGANQPVKQLSTGRVYISSQNHGYAVDNDSLPSIAKLSFVNTNDNTCEGITYTNIPAFSVQFHPEASGGPLDTNFLFDEFINLVNAR